MSRSDFVKYVHATMLGQLVVVLSVAFFCVASYAIILSAFLPLTGVPILDALAQDTHYKYFAVFLVPTGAYFVIANWVGWQYYRNT